MLFDMRGITSIAWLLLYAPLIAGDRVADIEFFGSKGLDVAKVREALPVREGDQYADRTKNLVRQAVVKVLGKEPTDVAVICCDDKGDQLLFIGLPGASSRRFTYHPAPQGKERLTPEIIDIYARLDRALEAAARRGGRAAEEDNSNGYALAKDPAARSLQLAVRQWALNHEVKLLRVLEFSSMPEHRRVASDALGYARQSRVQMRALVHACRDADDEVRNNATRALGVSVRFNAAFASAIPTKTFIEMLSAGKWTDRNKGTALLMQLTAKRNAGLLARIRSDALDSLIEMASWRRSSHAYFARVVLARVVGLPENQMQELDSRRPVDALIKAANGLR